MPTRDAWYLRMAVDGLRGALDRYAIAGERARLRHMSDTQLNDIGLTRHQALGEARRPFWQGRRCP